MSKTIITISREFGSGGRSIGKAVAKALNIPYYDRELINEVAEKTGFHRIQDVNGTDVRTIISLWTAAASV